LVSVIIPTLNAAAIFGGLYEMLSHQSLECEVTVIDSSSTDGTAKIARDYGARVTVIPRSEFDHGGTRNLGVKQAQGDILVFLTQDALPEKEDCLERLTAPLADPSVAITYGRQIPSSEASPLERFARLFNYPPVSQIKGKDDIPALGIKAFQLSNVCSAVRRKDFSEAGGFPSKIIMGEDTVLTARLVLKGYKVAYVAEATVIHSHDYTIGQQFTRYFDIGVSFATNAWLMEHATADREGARLVKEEIRYLLKEGKAHLFPLLASEIAAKLIAYKLGLYYRALPLSLCRRMSMHKGYWDRYRPPARPSIR
jgi:rhamnosyltransferase